MAIPGPPGGPSYGGAVDYSDNPILPPWYVPGWTAQVENSQLFSLPAPPTQITFSNLPSTLPYVNVTGTYSDGMGNNLGGYLTFEQQYDLLLTNTVNGVTSTFRLPKRLVGVIPNQNQNFMAWNFEGSGRVYLIYGMLNVNLLATDTPNTTIQIPYWQTQVPGFVQPTSWVYHVKEYFSHGMKYDISVPMADVAASVDINSLIIPNTYEPNDDWNRGF